MKLFLDTSVLVAAFWGDHPQHKQSIELLKTCTPETAFCSAHSVAETYSTMTRMPVKPPISAEHALLFIRDIQDRFTVVALTSKEYFATVERLASTGLAKNYIYDGLIMAAAAKSEAAEIYTWNIGHFRAVSPQETVSRIRTP